MLQDAVVIEFDQHLVAVESHALLEAVGDSALAGGVALSESSRATEWASCGTVADADDANVVSAADGSIAGHASGHLHGQREVCVGGQRETLNTETGDVLSDLGSLEGIGVSATGGAVDLSRQWASAILVDLHLVSKCV
jgi:hypothetical protein